MPSLLPSPKFRAFTAGSTTSPALPLVGGKLYTYAAGTTTPKATYTDAAGLIPNTNPIILDARGEATIFWDGAYKVVMQDALGATIWTVDNVSDSGLLPATLDAALRADLANATNAAKGAGQIGYRTSTVAARLDEELTTTGYVSLQAAVTAAAGKRLRVIGTHTITVPVAVQNNTTIILGEGASVETATANISHFDCANRTNVQIYGPGKIKKTGSGTVAYMAGVLLDNSINCLVYGVEMEGLQWAGVWMRSAINCHALRNNIHDGLGTIQDSAGITVFSNCVGCSVEDNTIKNHGWHGILVQDPGGATIPIGTRIVGNDIDGATAYGIANYHITASNGDSLIANNRIRNISGANPAGSGGSGIYIQSVGGVRCIGNHIRNVCTATTNNTLTPGGIGVNNIGGALAGPVITGNVINDIGITAAGVPNTNAVTVAGIYIASCASGAAIGNNSISQENGLAFPNYIGIYANASSNVTIGPHNLKIPTTGATRGVLISANNIAVSNISLSGVNVSGGSYAGIETLQVGGFSVSKLTINGGVLSGGSAACISLRLSDSDTVALNGVVADANTVPALQAITCPRLCIVGGSLVSSGATSISMSGVCTDSYIDKSVTFGGAGKMNNAGTGAYVEFLSAGIPTAGTFAIGNRAEQRVKAAAAPKGWARVTAGSGHVLGTDWLTEGNL